MDDQRQVTVPMYEIDAEGAVLPSPLFHRTIDKLHSRCIEYPFAAALIAPAERILDTGIAHADPIWIQWLESLSIEVHATDYDPVPIQFNHIRFHQADIRRIPIQDGYFDKIVAISIIEHIGMEFPQVTLSTMPPIAPDGDVDAVKELARLLKHGGDLIMTVPFGKSGLGSDIHTRVYTTTTIKKFEQWISPVSLDYYEYQYRARQKLCYEFPPKKTYVQKIHEKRFELINREMKREAKRIAKEKQPKLAGGITWRRIPMEETEAIHYGHADGILCGVWRKW